MKGLTIMGLQRPFKLLLKNNFNYKVFRIIVFQEEEKRFTFLRFSKKKDFIELKISEL
jgi:hypothetical protein